MHHSPHVRRAPKVRCTTRHRSFNRLGYVALLLLGALITYRQITQGPRGSEPQIALSARVEGASVQPASHR